MNGFDDLDVLAARVAVCTWQGEEGALSQEIRRSDRLTMATLASWLARWGVARNVPKQNRERFLEFMNDKAIPAYRGIKHTSGEAAYEIVDKLSQFTIENQVLDCRPTSLISKLGLAMLPEIFIPYDKRVRGALKSLGFKVPEHSYVKYMSLVLAEKPAFVRTLAEKGLTAKGLGAGEMSQSLFEMRALDKRLMLKGGFSPEGMARDLVRR